MGESAIASSVRDAFEADPFVSMLGTEVIEAKEGRAILRATVKPQYTNSLGTGHGGFLFTLADTAFAYAILSRGAKGAGIATHMEYLAPVGIGQTVWAKAVELHRGNRIATYRVELVKEDDQLLVAHFSGTAYLFSLERNIKESKNNRNKEQFE